VNISLFVHIPILAVAAQEPLFSHDVSLTAAVSTIFLLDRIKVVVGTAVTGFVVVHIDPSTPLAVPTLFLFGSGGHFMIGMGQVKTYS
jgi:hypothetical protein